MRTRPWKFYMKDLAHNPPWSAAVITIVFLTLWLACHLGCVWGRKSLNNGMATGGIFSEPPHALSPPQRFKHSLYQSAVRSVPQAQSRMDRSGGEPLPDVLRFLVHPCRFLVHRWISRLWLNLTAWNSQNPIGNYFATDCIIFFEV